MTSCPNEQKLATLLADALSAAERDSLARHLEGCVSCQQKLARLTGIAETDKWQRVEHSAPGSAIEEEMVQRLKRAGPSVTTNHTVHYATPTVHMEPAVPGYQILGELGRGGMGIVYRARQLALHRTVALKMVLSGAHTSAKSLARFRSEAEVIARLQHPNIVQIYDVGEAAGQPYFVLEFVGGGSLAQRLDGTPLPARAAAQLVKTLAWAVHAAHANGVVHRDLKPANILLSPADSRPTNENDVVNRDADRAWLGAIPKITDFGLAKSSDGESDSSGPRDPTVSGDLLGTPHYLAPEQAATPRQPVGPGADIYSLGAILYELLTGRPPFTGETPLDTVLQVLHNEPVSVTRLQPGVPPDLETICLKCLRKDPHKRYDSALELAEDLNRFQSGEPIWARPPSALYRWGKFAQRNKALVGGVAAVLIALTLGAAAANLLALRESAQRRRADQQRDEAVRQSYYASMAAAEVALRDDDVAAAARQLGAAPAALRGWEWRHLHSRLDESSIVVPAEPQGPMLLASGGNGIQLVTAVLNKPILIDPDTGARLAPWNGIQWVCHVERTASGAQIFGLNESGQFVWMDETGAERLRLTAPPIGQPTAVDVSPDHERLAIYWNTPAHAFDLYDLPSGHKRAICAGHTDSLHALVFSSDGSRILSASDDQTARLWDADTGAPLRVFRGHRDKIWNVAFSPDGTRVVTASADDTVRQWETATGHEIGLPYRGHRHEVLAAVYSPDGRWIASGSQDGAIRVWDADLHNDVAVLHGHSQAVFQLAFSKDGRRLVSVGMDRTGRIWELGDQPDAAVLAGHTSYVYPLAYSPDGRWIASGSWDHTIRIWDAKTGQLGTILPHGNRVRALAFARDSTWLVSGYDEDSHLTIWDLATAKPKKVIAGPGVSLYAIAVSPDGAQIAAEGNFGDLRIIDVASGQEVAAMRLTEGGLGSALAYSPDGRWLAVIAPGPRIDLWDTRKREFARTFTGHTGTIHSLAFSPDGSRLVSAGDDLTVRIWNITTGAPATVLKGHTDEIFAAVFHPDGTRIASAGRDRVIHLWDVATGAEVARLHGHTNFVFSLAFSPDGRTLASGSGDFTIRLWDTAPLSERFKARREAELLRPEAERLVARLYQSSNNPSDVVRALRSDVTLSDTIRRAAQRAVWQRCATHSNRIE